jgi:hypothetical protein
MLLLLPPEILMTGFRVSPALPIVPKLPAAIGPRKRYWRARASEVQGFFRDKKFVQFFVHRRTKFVFAQTDIHECLLWYW